MTLHSLRVAHHVLSEVLVKARADEERGARFKNSEQEAEKARVGRALLGFEEDRRLKREKDDRDKSVPSTSHRFILTGAGSCEIREQPRWPV